MIRKLHHIRVSNLEPDTEYEFMVNAVTWQHKNNINDLYTVMKVKPLQLSPEPWPGHLFRTGNRLRGISPV